MLPTRTPDLRIPVRFRAIDDLEHVDDALRADLSALAAQGRSLFTACDETSTVERLVLHGSGQHLGEHRSFALGEGLDLPRGIDGEMDIEGLAIDGGALWVTGSHSLKRPKVGEVERAELVELTTDANRHVLARVPLVERGEGVFDLDLDGATALTRPRRYGKGHPGVLRGLLAADPLLGPFMELPCKEGGFDIEGLAVRGEQVLLGLRSPVPGRHAALVALRLEVRDDHLKARRLTKGGARYAVHLVDLDGYGIRDLLFDGDDLLFLVGPVTDTDGIQAVFRWPDALAAPFPEVVPRDRLVRELDLPVALGQDHAEGLAHLDLPHGRHLLVAYDSPGDHRLACDDRLLLDAYRVGAVSPR